MEKLGKAPAGQRLPSSARDAALAEQGKKKKDSSFYSQAGVVGCLRAVGATTAGPGNPPAPPSPPAKPPGAHKSPCPATELLSGHVENTGGCSGRGLTAGLRAWRIRGRGAAPVHSSLVDFGSGYTAAKCSTGAGEGSGMPSVVGGTPRAAEGLVAMTGHREGSGVEPVCGTEQGQGGRDSGSRQGGPGWSRGQEVPRMQ